MWKTDRILLASHGTEGARAAEHVALALCRPSETEFFHLTVVPDLWRGMMGDDWLNNASTRDTYCRHIESELGREIDIHRQALAPRVVACGARYRPHVALGDPAECLLEFASQTRPDLIVIGSPRPRGQPGLRSRMRVDRLLGTLQNPLLIVPHPR